MEKLFHYLFFSVIYISCINRTGKNYTHMYIYIHTTENIVATWVAMPDVLLSRKACEQTPSKHHAKFFTRQLKMMPGVIYRLRMDARLRAKIMQLNVYIILKWKMSSSSRSISPIHAPRLTAGAPAARRIREHEPHGQFKVKHRMNFKTTTSSTALYSSCQMFFWLSQVVPVAQACLRRISACIANRIS